MVDRIIFNGTPYPSLNDLPADVEQRIRSFADQPIWDHLPDGLTLVVRTVNMTSTTWLTTDVDRLPTLFPSAVATLPNEAANTPAARGRRAASALVSLYLSHFNTTLSPDEKEQLIGLAGDVPEQAAARLRTLVRPYLRGEFVDVSAFRAELTKEQFEKEREVLEQLPESGFPDVVCHGYPLDLNPRLEYDGSSWCIKIPQVLCVDIREPGPVDTRPPGSLEVHGDFLVEGGRVVQYVANEKRDRSAMETGSTVYTGWTDDIPPPPSSAQNAFQTAVLGNADTSMSSRFCGEAILIAAIAAVTVTGVLLVVRAFLLAVDLSDLFSFLE